MGIFQIVYMSSLVADSPELLPAILEVAVRNNKQNSITGMMLYADGNVMQVLEGERDVVLKTFKAIDSDPRHSGIFVLIEQEVATRQFASWSMGFKQLSEADLENLPVAAHIFRARQEEISLRGRAGDALVILKSFAEGSMGII
jgi:hypothetical protein